MAPRMDRHRIAKPDVPGLFPFREADRILAFLSHMDWPRREALGRRELSLIAGR